MGKISIYKDGKCYHMGRLVKNYPKRVTSLKGGKEKGGLLGSTQKRKEQEWVGRSPFITVRGEKGQTDGATLARELEYPNSIIFLKKLGDNLSSRSVRNWGELR